MQRKDEDEAELTDTQKFETYLLAIRSHDARQDTRWSREKRPAEPYVTKLRELAENIWLGSLVRDVQTIVEMATVYKNAETLETILRRAKTNPYPLRLSVRLIDANSPITIACRHFDVACLSVFLKFGAVVRNSLLNKVIETAAEKYPRADEGVRYVINRKMDDMIAMLLCYQPPKMTEREIAQLEFTPSAQAAYIALRGQAAFHALLARCPWSPAVHEHYPHSTRARIVAGLLVARRIAAATPADDTTADREKSAATEVRKSASLPPLLKKAFFSAFKVVAESKEKDNSRALRM